jgi:Protein of unknown function (DUF2934)
MKTIVKSASSATEMQISTGLEEQIRYRAYQLYEQRGNADGYELEDWLRAEAEILGSKREPVAA